MIARQRFEALARWIKAHRAFDSGKMQADVVEQRDQTALRRAEHFQTLVNSLDYGVAVVGGDGRVESANPAADRIFGTKPEALKNRPANRALDFPIYDTDGCLVGADRHPLTQIRQTGTPISDYVFGVDRSDGQRVWLCASYRLLNPDDLQHSAVLISFTDITAQRTASERLATDERIGEGINRWLRVAILRTVAPRRAEIAAFIRKVVENWDSETLVRRIELQVGRDLQYIRINGTLVGGLVGLIIFTVTQWV